MLLRKCLSGAFSTSDCFVHDFENRNLCIFGIFSQPNMEHEGIFDVAFRFIKKFDIYNEAFFQNQISCAILRRDSSH